MTQGFFVSWHWNLIYWCLSGTCLLGNPGQSFEPQAEDINQLCLQGTPGDTVGKPLPFFLYLVEISLP